MELFLHLITVLTAYTTKVMLNLLFQFLNSMITMSSMPTPIEWIVNAISVIGGLIAIWDKIEKKKDI